MKQPIRKGKIHLLLPYDWRQGQSISNFLWWIRRVKLYDDRAFYNMEDDKFESLWFEYMATLTNQ